MFSSDLSAFISWKGGRRARPGTGENLRYFYSLMERARESLGSSGDWQTGLRYGATVSGRGWCRGNHWCITGRVSKKKGVQVTIITSWRVAKWINYLDFFLSCTELFHALTWKSQIRRFQLRLWSLKLISAHFMREQSSACPFWDTKNEKSKVIARPSYLKIKDSEMQ